MIHRVTANQSSFRSVSFSPGMNVVLADRTEESTEKDTRNGLGKSTLLDVIDFCLGATVRRGHGLAIDELRGWEFTLELDFGGRRVAATRALDQPRRISVRELEATEDATPSDLFGGSVYDQKEWRGLLAEAMFGLGSDDADAKYRPSFRSLLSYFIRRGASAYSTPFRHHEKQRPWNEQLHVAFLLGMNWSHAAKWQDLKDREKALRAVQQAIDVGELPGPKSSVGELEVERVHLENQLSRESAALENFKVHPQYDAIQEEADQLTTAIHKLVNSNVTDTRMLGRYKEAVEAEAPPVPVSTEKFYGEVGVTFPEAVARTLVEAKRFHAQIVANRRSFLATEMSRLEDRIQKRDEEKRRLTEKRASLLRVLRTHGALQEMTRLQERVTSLQGELDRIKAGIEAQKASIVRRREIKMEKADLTQVAERDHEERRAQWSESIRKFSANSKALYRVPGQLVIDVGDSGFSYNVEINKSGSDGVDKMKVFCFDLMLMESMSQRSIGVDFLIHDSTIFDGVDSRQTARALERASKMANATGRQYICTLNSDMVPRDDFTPDFDFDSHVKLVLTDKEPSGSLLGLWFNR